MGGIFLSEVGLGSVALIGRAASVGIKEMLSVYHLLSKSAGNSPLSPLTG